jgi:tripartite-type tricarboxylate transporter receptor subunit TctC
MPSIRSIGVAGACLCVVTSIFCSRLEAQEWPTRPVKLVVAFAPGGSADQLGRLFAAELSTAFRQQFYVENKPGNSGSIGSALVARAEPDGYSLLVAGSGPHLTGPAINPNIGYDPLKDFTHIAMIAADSFVLAANPALNAGSVAELSPVANC